jgi:ribosome maturation factor RimP
MKIVYCILGTFNSGGMERVLANKSNYLAQLGHEITIITTDQNNRKP